MAETSKTADQALVVLIELAEHGALTAAELARRLGMNRTVVHRLLSTLHERGFVSRQEEGYVPGAVLVRMAERVQPELRAAAAATMRAVARDVGETVVMHVPDGDDAVVLQQVVGDGHVLRVQHVIGSRHSLSHGASGRALLAHMAPATVERVLRTAARPDLLARTLDGVRNLGYAVSHDELQQGVHGLAVPVRDDHGHVLASLAIIVPALRGGGIVENLATLEAAARAVSKALWGGLDGVALVDVG
jgi:IclR family transcriptional regulator, KDG regulon repressor